MNAKAIYVNGKFQPYLPKSRGEGKRASKILTAACGFDVSASAVIVVMADSLRFKGSPDDVAVVGRKKIASWLKRQPAVLSPDTVDAIYAIARHRSTWIG